MKRAAKLACMIAGAVAAALAFCATASADTVTLTPEQTYALYMRDFFVSYHDTSSNIDYPLQMELFGTSAEIAPPDNLYVNGSIIDGVNTVESLWKLHNYIVIRFFFPMNSPFIPPYAQNDYITFESNLNVAGLNYYSGRILVSVGNGFRPSSNTAWATVQRSEFQMNTSGGVLTHQSLIGGSGRPTRIQTGLVKGTEGVIPTDDILYLTSDSSLYWFDSADTQSISKLTTIWKSPVQWGYSDPIGHTSTTRTNSYILYIECPTLSSGYIPPATTPVTTVATTRREYSVMPPQSTAPAHTVDLSNLESGVAAIVQQEQEINNNLEWIGNNVMGGVNNLAYICNRLDDIYRDMVKSGQIPVNLFPMDGTFVSDIQNGLTSFTTARIPTDAAAGLTFWAWLMGKITAVAFIGDLAAFGAVLAVTYFILFRGRNS